MDNKKKCKELRRIRKDLAKSLGINLNQKKCNYKGECSGTCPVCEEEERILSEALIKKYPTYNDKIYSTLQNPSIQSSIPDIPLSGLIP